MSNELVKPSRPTLARQGFGTQEIEMRRETQGSALAARAQAEVQARYIVAMQRPRNIDDVRIRLLDHCKRLGFAERAEYAKPVGGSTVNGPSIRFVETALQEYGNVEPDACVVHDDEEIRIIRVTMTDLERNITYHEDVVVEKIVEKRAQKRGDVVLGTRENSYGGTTFRIRAQNGDAELENRFAAEISKRTRKLGLRILPIDLVDEGMAECRLTLKNGDADPAATRKKVTDAFAEVGVMPRDLERYLGHPLASSSPTELADLRAVYRAVKDGESTWAELLEAKQADDADDAADKGDEPKGTIADTIAAKAAAVREAK